MLFFSFFFNDTATTEIYTLSLHDALPISTRPSTITPDQRGTGAWGATPSTWYNGAASGRYLSSAGPLYQVRSEEHTSELQSRLHLVCRLLLEKKKKTDVWSLPIIRYTPLC